MHHITLTLSALVLGILLAHATGHGWTVCLASLGLAMAMLLGSRFLHKSAKWGFVALLFISLGAFTLQINRPKRDAPPEGDYVVARVEKVRHLANYDLLTVQPLLSGDAKEWKNASQYAKARLTLSDYTTTQPGDSIWFANKLAPPEKVSNYYLPSSKRPTDVAFSQHLSGDYHLLGRRHTLSTAARQTRDHLLSRLENSSLSSGCGDFVSSLILGEKGQLDPEVRQRFSASGLAHLIAISGLHCGLLAALVLWLLLPLNLTGKMVPRLVLTLLIVFAFVWLIGMPMSALRASLMFGASVLAKLSQRRLHPFQALCLATLIILLFQPSALFDVGLQLSFVTVAALTLFGSMSQIKRPLRHRFIHHTNVLLTSTLVATMGCWALTAHYFHVLPLLFIVANVCILPLFPLYLASALLYIILLSCGWDFTPLSWLLERGYELTCHVADFCAGASVDIALSGIGTLLWLAALLCLCIALTASRRSLRRWSGVGAAVAATLCICSIAFTQEEQAPDGLILQGHNKNLSLMVYENGEGRRLLLPSGKSGMVEHLGTRVAFSDGKVPSGEREPCDYLLIGGRFSGEIKEAAARYGAKMVVLHTSIYGKRREKYLQEIEELGLECHDMTLSGPVQVWMP